MNEESFNSFMKNTINVVVFVVALVLGLATANELNRLTEQLAIQEALADTSKADKTQLENSLAEMQAGFDKRLEAAEKEVKKFSVIAEYEQAVTEDYKNAHTELETKLAEANAKVAGLEAKLAEANAKVSGLKTEVTEANAKVAGLESKLSVVDETASSIAAELANANKVYADVRGELADNLSEKAIIESELEATKAKVANPALLIGDWVKAVFKK